MLFLHSFQLPLFGIPFRYLAVLASLIPSTIFMFNTTGVILQGGVGKNKSTVAVSIDKTLHYNYFKIPSAYAVSFCLSSVIRFSHFQHFQNYK